MSTSTIRTRPRSHLARSDRGEGVISTAIAVLVMAFLGAAMWISFNAIWKDTSANTQDQVEIIGSDTDTQPGG
ncbi:hypothetical protein [Actinospongicola halichondriae]|uniref:hypothetical protein n=1 Tax=Actinospongicola halichondriae TaxID=3236844 RepID=UPI003D42554B